MLRELAAFESDSIFVIQTENILNPLLLDVYGVCDNHFLCHPEGSRMEVTRPGIALAGEILKCATWAQSGHSSSVDCLPAKLQLDPSSFSLREKRLQRHAHVQLIVHDSASPSSPLESSKLYLVEGNLLRQLLLTNATGALNSTSSHVFRYVRMKSDSFLKNFPKLPPS